jgi:hypothetical protein
VNHCSKAHSITFRAADIRHFCAAHSSLRSWARRPGPARHTRCARSSIWVSRAGTLVCATASWKYAALSSRFFTALAGGITEVVRASGTGELRFVMQATYNKPRRQQLIPTVAYTLIARPVQPLAKQPPPAVLHLPRIQHLVPATSASTRAAAAALHCRLGCTPL